MLLSTHLINNRPDQYGRAARSMRFNLFWKSRPGLLCWRGKLSPRDDSYGQGAKGITNETKSATELWNSVAKRTIWLLQPASGARPEKTYGKSVGDSWGTRKQRTEEESPVLSLEWHVVDVCRPGRLALGWRHRERPEGSTIIQYIIP